MADFDQFLTLADFGQFLTLADVANPCPWLVSNADYTNATRSWVLIVYSKDCTLSEAKRLLCLCQENLGGLPDFPHCLAFYLKHAFLVRVTNGAVLSRSMDDFTNPARLLLIANAHLI